jgi:RNase P/RNase MRP subunit POP5
VGLYGSINFHKSRIRIVNVVAISPQFVTIKCKLEFTDSILLSLYFTDYPLLILPVSGTIKKLKKRVQDFLIYTDFLLDS